MFVLIFLIILSVLVFVHEMGHFLVAKATGVKVEEFGFGYPPRAVKLFRKWDTDFTLNWIPFGGFVKIAGENYLEEKKEDETLKYFTEANKIWQICILAAGVTFNILLAWVLFASTFIIGTPYPADGEYANKIHAPVVMISSVVPEYPAAKAGIKPGDVIQEVERDGLKAEAVAGEELTTEAVSEFIGSSADPVSFTVKRGEEEKTFTVTPTKNAEGDRLIVGIGMDRVGILKLGIIDALVEGARNTRDIFLATVSGMWHLLSDSAKGNGDLSQVAGPVGIVGLVKDATLLGFVYLLSFTAFISINLAVVNLIPFPALDGGRILMVIIEAIKRSPVNPKIYNALNIVGFVLLIGLMVVITFNDILRLF